MKSRERFLETMSYGAPDHAPLLEEGIRPELLRLWREEGLPKDTNLSELFHFDKREEIRLDLRPHPPLAKWPVSIRGLDDMRERLNPKDPTRLPTNWGELVEDGKTNNCIRILRVHRGFFQTVGVGGWERFMQVMHLLTDKPIVVKEMMVIQSNFTVALVKHILDDLTVDAAIFSEPIAGNHGPLISPKMYREFVLSSYKPVIDVLSRNGVNVLIIRTYANVRALLPSMLDFGFNCLWACEVNAAEMDYGELRGIFGKDLKLIGGIDTDVIRVGKKEIKRELCKKVPPLLDQGGYLPLADSRVREGIPFENYYFYRQMLEKLVLR
jgi:uroporphyrinogen decarboxylase